MAEGTGKSSLKSVDETLVQPRQQHSKYCKFRKRQTYTYYFISTSSSHVIACLAVRHSAVDPNLITYLFLIFCRVQILHYFVLPFKKRIRWLLQRIMNKTRFGLWVHEIFIISFSTLLVVKMDKPFASLNWIKILTRTWFIQQIMDCIVTWQYPALPRVSFPQSLKVMLI